jgi:putative SOS response-associated peptidase YedK
VVQALSPSELEDVADVLAVASCRWMVVIAHTHTLPVFRPHATACTGHVCPGIRPHDVSEFVAEYSSTAMRATARGFDEKVVESRALLALSRFSYWTRCREHAGLKVPRRALRYSAGVAARFFAVEMRIAHPGLENFIDIQAP